MANSSQLQLRRGTASQVAAFTGAAGEVTPDMTNNRLVLHDGTTAGGHPVASEAYVDDLVGGAARVFSPYAYGGIGDGVADDGSALNAMFAAVRTEIASGYESSYTVVDLSGGIWRTDTGVNATGLRGASTIIRGGLFHGRCTGKPILDLVGSRGYKIQGTVFYGDPSAMPSCAFQSARATADSNCDGVSYIDVATIGWFSRAALHTYGQETALHLHCAYINYNYDARVAIFSGYDAVPFTSDFTTVMTGATSCINNKFVNCDFRYIPVGSNVGIITNVTNAASGVVTAPGHTFTVGSKIVFSSVGGMPNLTKFVANVTAVAGDDITIDVNTTGLGTYTSGGLAIKAQSYPSLYIGRMSQVNFDCCYVVAYGQPNIELDFPDAASLHVEQIDFDLLLEGAGTASSIRVNTQGRATSISGIRIRNYNSFAYTSLIELVTEVDPLGETVWRPG